MKQLIISLLCRIGIHAGPFQTESIKEHCKNCGHRVYGVSK